MADTTSPYRDVLPLPASSSGRLAAPPGPTARRLGDLELLGELARGGMGVVYRALDRRLGREVAVKVALGGAADPEELERFAVEARAAARLKHPNIVGIHRVGEEGGAPYLVMDLVPGESLQRRLGRDGPLPPREAARLCALLARALAFAHGRGVLHRDLKPHNVLVTPDGQPVLTDFGLAKEVDRARGVTMTGQVLGTPAYMAPEQARGDNERVDRRADVYGLGATLYAALTGRPPFQAASAIAVMAKVVDEPVEPPRRLRPEVDLDLETIVLKCLEKEPGARYDTAQDLADDLERYLAGDSIRARRLGALERAGRWVRRHRLASAGVAGALLLSLAVGAGSRAAEHERLLASAREAAAAAAREYRALPADDAASAEERLGRALVWLQAAQRWSDLARTREAREAQVEAAFALGDVACDGGQWTLARRAYPLSGLDPKEPRLVAATDGVAERRIRVARQALDDLRAGKVTDPQEVVYVLVRQADPATVRLVAERLLEDVDVLVRTRRDLLQATATPTPLEASAGWGPLDELPAAIQQLEGPAPDDVGAARAAQRTVNVGALRLARRRGGTTLEAAWVELARAQAEALGESGVRHATACAEALGRIGHAAPEVARAALEAHLRAELGTSGSRAAWYALARLEVGLDRLHLLHETRIGPLTTSFAVRAGDVLRPVGGDAGSRSSVLASAQTLLARGDPGALDVLQKGLDRWPDDPDLLITRVLAHVSLRAHPEALRDLARLTEVRPSSLVFALRARILAGLEEVERARSDLAEAERRARQGDSDAATWSAIGQAYQALGEHTAGASALGRALELDPEYTIGHVALAQSLLALRRQTEARATIETAVRLDPDFVQALLMRAEIRWRSGDVDGGLEDAERARALAPNMPRATELRAELLFMKRQHQEASHAAREVLARWPSSARARWVLAQVALAERRVEEAARECDEGLRSPTATREDRGLLLTSLSQAQLLLGRPDQTLATAGSALALDPDDATVLAIRAAARAWLGDLPGAVEDLDRSIALVPEDWQVWLSRARVHQQRGDAAAARRDYEAALALDRSALVARVELASLAAGRGELDEAERQLSLGLDVADLAELRVRRAQVRRPRGDLAGARGDLDRALQLNPGLALAWAERALLRQQQADAPGAVSDAGRALELAPRDADTLELLAAALAPLGQGARVLPHVEAALRVEPRPDVRARLERLAGQLRGR